MTLKTICHPVTGKTFKMGWKPRPRHVRPRGLLLGNYLLASLPAPPASADYFGSPVFPVLKDVMGNDSLGDCTCAGVVHVAGGWLANAGAAVPFTAANAIDLYEKACGYDPNDPSTDQGGDETDVLNYAMQAGIPPDGTHKVTAWAKVDPKDAVQIKQAIYLFENVYFGFGLYDAWVNPMPSGDGFVWDVPPGQQPDMSNGHCFVGLGYNDQGVIIDTWGMKGVITWAAVAQSSELYTLFGVDSIAKASGKAPNGFDATQLAADVQAYGG